MMSLKMKQLKGLLKERLNARRYEHSLNVMEMAEHLAQIHEADRQAAIVAGLLHDYAKNLSPEELRYEAQRLNVPLDDVVHRHMMLAHGPVGAAMIERDLGIEDKDILNAVHYHTFGRPDMSRLEKIIYLADFIEPGRRFKGVEELRRIAKENLDKAVLLAMESSLAYLIGSDRLMHPNTLLARNALIIQQNSRRHHGIDERKGERTGADS